MNMQVYTHRRTAKEILDLFTQDELDEFAFNNGIMAGKNKSDTIKNLISHGAWARLTKDGVKIEFTEITFDKATK